MDPAEAIPRHCPSCASSARVVHAAVLAQRAASSRVHRLRRLAASPGGREPARLLDVELSRRSLWSGMWACAAGCFVLTGAAVLFNQSRGWFEAMAVFAIFGVTFAALGVWQTRQNHALMRGAAPLVRRAHALALYCGSCQCVYFGAEDPRSLPGGIEPGKALPLVEYRRRLWRACGFTKPI